MRVATVSRADPAPIQRVLGPPREKAREVGSEENLFGAKCLPACLLVRLVVSMFEKGFQVDLTRFFDYFFTLSPHRARSNKNTQKIIDASSQND